jgi:hypothetical protein
MSLGRRSLFFVSQYVLFCGTLFLDLSGMPYMEYIYIWCIYIDDAVAACMKVEAIFTSVCCR